MTGLTRILDHAGANGWTVHRNGDVVTLTRSGTTDVVWIHHSATGVVLAAGQRAADGTPVWLIAEGTDRAGRLMGLITVRPARTTADSLRTSSDPVVRTCAIIRTVDVGAEVDYTIVVEGRTLRLTVQPDLRGGRDGVRSLSDGDHGSPDSMGIRIGYGSGRWNTRVDIAGAKAGLYTLALA